MAETTKTALRGVLVHDRRFSAANVDATLSSYTERAPEPDQPTATVSGFQQLEALGTADDAGAAYNVKSQVQGPPTGGDKGGRARWKKTTDGSTSWRGWLNANKVSGFEFARTGAAYLTPAAVRTPGHKVVCAYRVDATPAIAVSVLDPDTDSWTHATVDDGANNPRFPALVRLPDNTDSGGRLLCFYVTQTTSAGTTYDTLDFAYSDDDGGTWTSAGRRLEGFLQDATGDTVEALQVVYHAGYLTAVIESTNGLAWSARHYLSDSLGSAWTEIEGPISVKWSALFTDANGHVRMVHTDAAAGAGGLHATVKQSPRSTFDTSTTLANIATANVDAAALASGDKSLAAVVDDEGYLWVFWREYTARRYSIRADRYDPETMTSARDRWLRPDGTAAVRWPLDAGGDDATHLVEFCAVPYKGKILLIANATSTAGTTDSWLSVVELGGWSTVDWATQSFGGYDAAAKNTSGRCYLPIDLPANVSGWLAAGGGTETLTTVGLHIQSTLGNPRDYARNNTGGGTSGRACLVRARVRVDTGTTLTFPEHAIRLERADGSVKYRATLRLSQTGARLWDNYAAAQVGSDATGLPDGEFRDYILTIEATKVAAYWKTPTGTTWTLIASGTLTDGGSGTSFNSVKWGCLSSPGSGTNSSRWKFVGTSIDDDASPIGVATFTNPDDLQGRAFAQSALWLDAGLQIRAQGGATYKGDAWRVSARSRYGIANLHPEINPSPDVGWSSVSTTEQIIAWSPAGSGVDSRPLSSSIGVCLLRPNFSTAYFEGYNGSAWTTILTFDIPGTIDGSAGALTWTDHGKRVAPAAGTNPSGRFLEMDELVGGYALLTHGGGTTGAQIVQNAGGVWRAATSSRAAELLIDASMMGTLGPTTIKIIPRQVLGIAHDVGGNYQAWRLRIPAGQATKEGYYRLGGVVIGPLALFGTEYSWGRKVTTEPIADVVDLRGGQRRVRQLARPRTTVEFSWADPLYTADLYQPDPDPDYLVAKTGAGREGIATAHDHTLLRGLLRRTRSGQDPVVYLANVDPEGASQSTFFYSSPQRFLYGRVLGPVTETTLWGDEADTEGIAINAITISGEV